MVISGCSGGGKSVLLAELKRRGYQTVQEPGRRIVRQAMMDGRAPLPWVDAEAFARAAASMAILDRERAMTSTGRVFFDRCLVDAAAALERLTGQGVAQGPAAEQRYHRKAFLTPPWPEIYRMDAERRHDLNTARVEYEHLVEVFPALGYDCAILPKTSVGERADFIIDALDGSTR